MLQSYKSAVRRSAGIVLLAFMLPVLSVAESKLTISPSNPRQLNKSSSQFTALLNGKATRAPVHWSSSNPAVATIDGGGNAALLSPGTTTITASLGAGSQQASTMLTVTTAAPPVFAMQPTDTNVSAVINSASGVQVKLMDNLGGPLAGQPITISIGTNPPGTGTLSGTLTQTTNTAGFATFAGLKIDWLGNGYTLVASANPSSGPVSGTSAAFNELRVGDACLGPDRPACSSGCADSDGDGLNDAWEDADGIDLNGDGVIDAQ